jgi:hypothetical protein
MNSKILDTKAEMGHSGTITHNGFAGMIIHESIVPQFKPNYALELLYPLLTESRQVRDALITARNGALVSSEMAMYSPSDIEAIRL